MGFIGARIAAGEFIQHGSTGRMIAVINLAVTEFQVSDLAVIEHL